MHRNLLALFENERCNFPWFFVKIRLKKKIKEVPEISKKGIFTHSLEVLGSGVGDGMGREASRIVHLPKLSSLLFCWSLLFSSPPRLKKLKWVKIDKVKKELLSLKWKETIRYPTRKECSPWIQWNWTAYSLENCFKVAAVEIDFQMTLLFRRPPPMLTSVFTTINNTINLMKKNTW